VSSACGIFGERLWELAQDHQHPGSLSDFASKTLDPERRDQQLTVSTLLVDPSSSGDSVIERLAGRAGSHLLGSGEAARVGVLLVGHEDGNFVVSTWPAVGNQVVHLCASVPYTSSRWQMVERWAAGLRPLIARPYLNEEDFRNIGAALSEFGYVGVSRASARKWEDGSSWSRGWPGTASFDRPSLSEVLSEAEQAEVSLRTLSLHVGGELSLHLRRHAGATYYRGKFETFDKMVLSPLAAAASARVQLLADRSRRNAPEGISALEIRLASRVFAESTHDLVNELATTPRLGVSIFHRNPYFHAVLTDYRDGSSYDLYVTEDDRIIFYPGIRASTGSLASITEELADRFSGVSLGEAALETPPTLEELFTTG
jgi:hypothetical protein